MAAVVTGRLTELSCIMHIMNRQPSFVKEIASSLRQRCSVKAGDRLLIAVSGGADSVALLRVMASLADRRGRDMTLAVGHVNHGLREQAVDDAKLVQSLASELGVEYFEATLKPGAANDRNDGRDDECDAKPDNTEQWARHGRYEALAQMAESFEAMGVVAAHHADDQLETILMRLMRGSGVQSLAGMKWRRRLTPDSPLQLLRPMLSTTHEQAVNYLKSLNQAWCEDHTNTDTTRLRAALRAKVLPQLKALSPKLTARVMHTSEQLHGAGQVLGASVKQAIVKHVTEHSSTRGGQHHELCVDRTAARVMSPAVLQGMLRDLLIRSGVSADSLRREVVLKLAHAMKDNDGSVRNFAFGNDVKATLNRTQLKIASAPMRNQVDLS